MCFPVPTELGRQIEAETSLMPAKSEENSENAIEGKFEGFQITFQTTLVLNCQSSSIQAIQASSFTNRENFYSYWYVATFECVSESRLGHQRQDKDCTNCCQ